MSRTCTICRHPDRDEIDKALIENEPFRSIASRYGTSTTALQRHKRNDLPKALVSAKDAENVVRGDSLLEQMKDLNERTLKILKKAEDSGDFKIALTAIREVRGNLELCGRILGDLESQETHHHVNVVNMDKMAMRFLVLHGRHPSEQELRELRSGIVNMESVGNAQNT